MATERYARLVDSLFSGARVTATERLTGGVSAEVHRLDVSLADGESTRVVLRLHREGHEGHSAELEFRLLQTLHRQGIPVPKPLAVDESGGMLANPFLVMTFIAGSSEIPAHLINEHLESMAEMLLNIHGTQTHKLPVLPLRYDPLPEVFDYLPDGSEWQPLKDHLNTLVDTAFTATPKLLHGDFWPENLLWRNGAIAAVIDWEHAALGDPLSDLAVARVELRYRFGKSAMQQITDAYARYASVDLTRLALWQVYVAAAAQHFMGDWGLAPELEAHMRREALASIQEAGVILMNSAPSGSPRP
jgi:aminoglycoside phosphotransferase (APT) family kinase protein